MEHNMIRRIAVPTALGIALARAASQDLAAQAESNTKVDHQRWVGRRVAYNMENTTLGVKVMPSTVIKAS
jgi:hypothetical protein